MKWYKSLSDTGQDIFKIVVALVFLAGFVVVTLIDNYKTAQKEMEISHQKEIVTDNSRYFTVIGCVKKYLNYVQTGATDEILLLLNSEYKDQYGVNSANLSNHIPRLDTDAIYDYIGTEMYQKRISKNVIEFYVKGQIVKDIMDEKDEYKDYSITVILYEKDFLFSIRPGVSEV